MSRLAPLHDALRPVGCLRPLGAARPALPNQRASETLPLVVHWSDAAGAARAEATLEAAELAWTRQTELGFPPPVLPDTEHGPELDLYLYPVGDGQAFVLPDGWEDPLAGDGWQGTSAWMGLDENLPLADLPIYVAHEFNHVLQFAAAFNEPRSHIWEATATAAQHWTLGARDAEGRFVIDTGDGTGAWESGDFGSGAWAWDTDSWQELPWAPTLLGDSSWLWPRQRLGFNFEYGAAQWLVGLDRELADGDGGLGPRLWRALADDEQQQGSRILAALEQEVGPLPAVLDEVAVQRWLVGSEWGAPGVAEGSLWDESRQVPHTVLEAAELPVSHLFRPRLQITGQGFMLLPQAPALDVAVVSPSETPSVLTVVGLQGEIPSVIVERWSASGVAPALRVEPGAADRIMVAVSHLPPAGWSEDDSPYQNGDHRLRLSRADEPVDWEALEAGCQCTQGLGAQARGAQAQGALALGGASPLGLVLLCLLLWRSARRHP